MHRIPSSNVHLISLRVPKIQATFVKFGRSISRAGIDPSLDPIAPLLLLACAPPGLQGCSNGMDQTFALQIITRDGEKGREKDRERASILRRHFLMPMLKFTSVCFF